MVKTPRSQTEQQLSRSTKTGTGTIKGTLLCDSIDNETRYGSHSCYGGSNQLVIQSGAGTGSKKPNLLDVRRSGKKSSKKKLSKKQRRKLEAVINRKKNNSVRKELLLDLQKVSATQEEIGQLVSVTEIGQKRKFKDTLSLASTNVVTKLKSVGLSALQRKKRRIESLEATPDTDSNTSGSESSSESSSESYNVVEDTINDAGNFLGTESNSISNEVETISKIPVEESLKVELLINYTATDVPVVSAGSPRQPLRRPARHVPVARLPAVDASRRNLPITSEEQPIMELIADNDVVVICGSTGSGKTTQVPQFLYEAGYAEPGPVSGGTSSPDPDSSSGTPRVIGVTEPRRLAAIAMSRRVAFELNLPDCESVSYRVRFDSSVNPRTRIQFMTDGILLKELQEDFLLSRYSAVLIDEAHERSLHTDILLGLLSRIVPLRRRRGNPLKLVIMSATLRIEDFTRNPRLFAVPPPVVSIDARQFPVSVHFNRRTEADYLREALRKVCKIHRTQPAGGVLVFVTGQREVHTLCGWLRARFPESAVLAVEAGRHSAPNPPESAPNPAVSAPNPPVLAPTPPYSTRGRTAPAPRPVNLASYSVHPEDDDLRDLSCDEDEVPDDDDSAYTAATDRSLPLLALPLYSLLPSARQARVFETPPSGVRLCVVSTNVAETSLTIPGIRYVVDTGRTKRRFHDASSGVSAYRVGWTSRASADQRAGRAGRLASGRVHRLYSSAIYSELPEFDPPDILCQPVDGVVLEMKQLGVEKVVNFPFPTPPSGDSLRAAERLLIRLGALRPTAARRHSFRADIRSEFTSSITPLGGAMVRFPVAPRFAKMLAMGRQHGLLGYVVALVAGLTVREVFDPLGGAVERRRFWLAGCGSHGVLLGDFAILLRAVCAAECATATDAFCSEFGLRRAAMLEVSQLRRLLTATANRIDPETRLTVDPKLKPPTETQYKLLRQIVTGGLVDRMASKNLSAIVKKGTPYRQEGLNDPVYIHPTSVLVKKLPEHVVYAEAVESGVKVYMRTVCAIDPKWLTLFDSKKLQKSS